MENFTAAKQYRTKASARRWVEARILEGHGSNGSPMPQYRRVNEATYTVGYLR